MLRETGEPPRRQQPRTTRNMASAPFPPVEWLVTRELVDYEAACAFMASLRLMRFSIAVSCSSSRLMFQEAKCGRAR